MAWSKCMMKPNSDERWKPALIFVGTNNRNLATFEVDLKVMEQLAPKLPEGCTIVSESGMRTALIWPCAPADSRNRPAKIIKPVDRHSVIKDGHN
jgi:hypothetical protein